MTEALPEIRSMVDSRFWGKKAHESDEKMQRLAQENSDSSDGSDDHSQQV